VIALTFDDGPEVGNTEQILAVLAQNNVKATFFQMGNKLTAAPDLGRAVRNAGHAIGNHTWSHQEAPANPLDEVQRADTAIQSVYGGPTALFRPPFGNFQNGVVQVALDQNHAVIIWSVDPKDWDMPGASVIVNNVLAGATPGGIVLLHDGGGDRSQTIAALPQIISGLRSQGYRFVTVPELLALGAGGSADDMVPPVLTITTPVNNITYHSVTAAGTVTDAGSGVAGVRTTLRRPIDGLYWNGTTWTTAASILPAQVNVNNWSLPLTFLADGRYSLSVSATDKANNVSSSLLRDFVLDNAAPTVGILTPATGSTITSLTSATGVANDVGGLQQVVTSLMRNSDGYWWTGSTWVPAYTEVPASLVGNSWSLPIPTLASNSYTLWAQSVDFIGNRSAWAKSIFTINSSAAVTRAASASQG
jgi:peptidoglycan/xylan/chitin deacetylase (PgdA/CDA1 family)